MRAIEAWRALPEMQRIMLTTLFMAVVAANVAQPFPDIAPLQHIPTLLLMLMAPSLLARWPLSNRSVALLTGFWLLHTFGGRYTYSNVPYDDWARALSGYDLSSNLGLARNGYDRLVHFCFGLLFFGPVAEALRRHASLGRVASLWMSFLTIGAGSAVYEVFEWMLTMLLAPGLADEYNGQQGDMWDAQKDMGIAMLGAIVARVTMRSKARTVR